METVFYSASENDTFAFGKALGELAGPGTFIALNGISAQGRLSSQKASRKVSGSGTG